MATTIALTSTAQAAYVCESGQVCLYEGVNFTGSAYVVNGTISDARAKKFTNGATLNDSISSIDNKSGHSITIGANIKFAGLSQVITKDATAADLRGWRYAGDLNWNDIVSAIKVG